MSEKKTRNLGDIFEVIEEGVPSQKHFNITRNSLHFNSLYVFKIRDTYGKPKIRYGGTYGNIQIRYVCTHENI